MVLIYHFLLILFIALQARPLHAAPLRAWGTGKQAALLQPFMASRLSSPRSLGWRLLLPCFSQGFSSVPESSPRKKAPRTHLLGHPLAPYSFGNLHLPLADTSAHRSLRQEWIPTCNETFLISASF